MMATEPTQLAEFLADLELVCPNSNGGGLSPAFLDDLVVAHRYARASSPKQPTVSIEDLAALAGVFDKWRASSQKLPPTFLNDLQVAYAYACASPSRQPAVSVEDLASLAGVFDEWRTSYRNRLQQYLERLPEDDPLLCPVSLFGTMDYGRLETAHTRALAWLLDDREHGFGHRLLETLLIHLLDGMPVRLTHVGRVASEYPIHCGPSAAATGRIDILAEGDWERGGKKAHWLLVIEAKIDADEGESQLSLYDDWIEQNAGDSKVVRVFLAPKGRTPQTANAEWETLHYVDLAGVIRGVDGLTDKAGYHFLRYYLTGVLRDICDVPVPISADAENPYDPVDYLQSVLEAVPSGES